MNFSSVILAGGKSSRMGRDKAWIEIDGRPLLEWQIECARRAGAREILISGRARVDYSAFGCPVLTDKFEDVGPLAGIARALVAVREPLLLALAVDMPEMSSDFLKRLHAHCGNGIGSVPVCEGMIEPLAAFYPKSAGGLLRQLLTESKPARSPGAKHFAKICVEAGLARFIAIPVEEGVFFKSWNSPADFPSQRNF